jgi:RND superfamily putative drug exporter
VNRSRADRIRLAVAVLLDAVAIRIMILPELMTLLGDKNWWLSRAVLRTRAAAAQEPLTMSILVVR